MVTLRLITCIQYATIHFCYAMAVEFISYNPINATRNAAKTDGHVILGGLFPIHNHNEQNSISPCGTLNHERGIHRLEAMFYACDLINQNRKLLPNFTVGVEIRDTCGVATYALEEAVPFVIGSLDYHRGTCAINKGNRIQGVIGAASSSISIQIANLLRLFQVPQVSYASTSPDLNDRKRFEYFLRTVPPDTYQARAMIDIIKHFNWTSVHGIYSEGNYGQKGMDKFREHAQKNNICLISASLVNGKSNFVALLRNLAMFKNTHVVVLFLSTDHIQLLLDGASKVNGQFKFKWLASEYWGTRIRFMSDVNLRKAADGAITLTLETKSVQGYVNYFKNLTVYNNKRNPWFARFWEETFNCTFSSTFLSKRKMCIGNESLPDNYKFDDKVPYVLDAVLAMGHALDSVLPSKCDDQLKACGLPFLKGSSLLKALNNISYNGTLGPVKFDENGSTVREYEIMEFIDGEYRKVGKWLNSLSEMAELKKPTHSFCAVPCPPGEIKTPKNGLICCYKCKRCTSKHYASGETT